MGNVRLSVVIPAYNEQEVLEETYKRLKGVMDGMGGSYELVFVNDGSKDKTSEMLFDLHKRDSAVKVVEFARNFGHQIAVTAGLDYATGDAIVIIDADLQDPPEAIPEMVKLWEQGYEVVYGKRLKRKGESIFKKLTAHMFYRFLSGVSTTKIPLDTGDFRLIDKKVADVMRSMKEGNRFLRGMVAWAGFNQTAYEYVRDERFAGETKYPLKKMLKLSADGIASFSSKPLSMSLWLGVIMMVLSVLYFIATIVLRAVGVAMAAWNYAAAAILLSNSLILVAIGIVGVYLGRVYDEAKARPIYIVGKAYGFDTGKE
ncbi:MAG: glycosyltransferase family 2 protein [Christensenellales bacterium]|jgi:glycosyltransferase involved in cell wall biosynthesis